MKYFLFFISVLSACFSNAQEEQYVYKNDFSDPDLFFPSYNDKQIASFTKNGVYHIEYKDSIGSYRPATSLPVYDPDGDYTIETEIKLVSGDENENYGLSFGYGDRKSANFFVCSGNGYFAIYASDEGELKIIHDLEKNSSIKNDGSYNVLKVKKTGQQFYFYINETKVAVANDIKSYGTKVGFWVGGRMKVEIHSLNVKQKIKPINLVEGWDKFGTKEHFGSNINSPYDDRHPIISPDGLHLYVNRVNHPGNVGGKKEDIWVADFVNGKWSELKNMGRPLNNDDFNYASGISADNTLLLLGNVYGENESQPMTSGYSISYKTKNGWGKPKGITIKNYYNRSNHNGGCISADKKVLITSTERDDSNGGTDLYFSFRNDDSTWTEPVNLGSVLNSWSADFGPYLASDGKTLYFSSYGHPGYGAADIFMSKRLDDTWKNWSVPQNLGPKFNTKYWDGYFSVSAQGDYAYISSTDGGRKDIDCYFVKLPQTAAPEYVVLLKGKVLNDKTKLPMGSEIKLVESATGKIIQTLESGNETGDYSILIHKAGKYDIASFHEGFISIHKTIETGEIKAYKEIKLDLMLTPLETGQTIVLKNIFFTANKFDLLASSNEELNKLVTIMKENPSLKIQVSGHTSRNSEGEKFNEELSTNRALAVKNYLIQNGIPESRIVHKGFGFSKPIYTEEDEGHQAQNRRVEFTILSK